MSRIGFSGAIDRLPAVQDTLAGLQPLTPGGDPKQIEALRAQVRNSMGAVVTELGREEGPDVLAVDAHLADARTGIEDLGRQMGYIDESGAVAGDAAATAGFHDVSDYLTDIEVAWRNQRPTLLELQNALPFRRSRFAMAALATAAVILLLMWLLFRNGKPSPVAASDAPIFPNPPLSSVAPPSLVSAPPFNTNLNVSSRPNTTPPLQLSLPNETRTRTAGTDFPSLDISTMLPTTTSTKAATGPLIVDPQTVRQRCNKDNTFLAPTAYKIINHTGRPVLYSVTVSGNWATAAPAAGSLADGQTTLVGETPAQDSAGRIYACDALINEGRTQGDYYLTITVDNVQYVITVTVLLYNS